MMDCYELEELVMESERLSSMASLIEAAIVYAPGQVKDFEGALSLFTDCMYRHTRSLKSYESAAFAELRRA